MIEITEKQINRLQSLLGGMGSGRYPMIALKNASQRALTTFRNEMLKGITKEYSISINELRKLSKINIEKVFDVSDNRNYIMSNAQNQYNYVELNRIGRGIGLGSITFSGHVIPLIKFNYFGDNYSNKKYRNTKGGYKGVITEVLRGETTQLKHAYVTNLGHYGKGMFERERSWRDSSKQLYGPSVAHMANNEEVINKAEKPALKMLDERIEHEITRILNGYGGRK